MTGISAGDPAICYQLGQVYCHEQMLRMLACGLHNWEGMDNQGHSFDLEEATPLSLCNMGMF